MKNLQLQLRSTVLEKKEKGINGKQTVLILG